MPRMSSLAVMRNSLTNCQRHYRSRDYQQAADAAQVVIDQWKTHWMTSGDLSAHEAREYYATAITLRYKALLGLPGLRAAKQRADIVRDMEKQFHAGDQHLQRVLALHRRPLKRLFNRLDDTKHPIQAD